MVSEEVMSIIECFMDQRTIPVSTMLMLVIKICIKAISKLHKLIETFININHKVFKPHKGHIKVTLLIYFNCIAAQFNKLKQFKMY